ncbi:MAG: RagB/SusD family nutrient uptake outer membrane protein [Tannerellaceae bacterium]|jgi:hypothetical protein|nr:RagB/SusD family nutrient uptake outer membrane protein [Tannerellaceae bacterium]
MNKLIYWAMFALVLLLPSCNDFLEEEARTNPAANSFFASRADAFASVNILYNKGVEGMYTISSSANTYYGARIMYTSYSSGLIDNVSGKGQDQFFERCQMLNIDPIIDNSILQGLWSAPYEAIVRNANYAIENLPACPELTDAERRQLIGEASFFRALNYFNLVKTFGPVPLILNSYHSLENIFVGRSSEKLVYEQILRDLEVAIDAGLPDKPMPENGFRVSRGSVLALAADVCLNMAGAPVNDASKYADAARYAKELIGSPNYGLIRHGADISDPANWDRSAYNILRTSDNEKEYLFVKEYDRSILSGGFKPAISLPFEAASWGEFVYATTNLAWQPDPILHAAYNPETDLRYREHQYFHSSYVLKKGPNAGEARNFIQGKIPYFWWEEDALINTAVSEKDNTNYRLAEMYLIAAEALVMSGGAVSDEAAGYLSEIEARASLDRDKETIKAGLLALSREEFIKEVWTEKIRELLFEFKLWNDISRTRMFPAIVNGKFDFVPLIGAVNPYGATFTEQNLYFPICDQERQRNPALSDPVLQ